jgi:hypothetical protein
MGSPNRKKKLKTYDLNPSPIVQNKLGKVMGKKPGRIRS